MGLCSFGVDVGFGFINVVIRSTNIMMMSQNVMYEYFFSVWKKSAVLQKFPLHIHLWQSP